MWMGYCLLQQSVSVALQNVFCWLEPSSAQPEHIHVAIFWYIVHKYLVTRHSLARSVIFFSSSQYRWVCLIFPWRCSSFFFHLACNRFFNSLRLQRIQARDCEMWDEWQRQRVKAMPVWMLWRSKMKTTILWTVRGSQIRVDIFLVFSMCHNACEDVRKAELPLHHVPANIRGTPTMLNRHKTEQRQQKKKKHR